MDADPKPLLPSHFLISDGILSSAVKFKEADERKECEGVYTVPLVEPSLCRRLLQAMFRIRIRFREGSVDLDPYWNSNSRSGL